MTAQIPDTFLFNDKLFSITGVNGKGLFEPASLGVHLIPPNTACWRGYICQYQIQQNKLVLDKLQMSLRDETGPTINGVTPGLPEKKFMSNNVYEHLGLEIKFTGSILIADGFIQNLYVHMGFQPAWKYETVFELSFQDGDVGEIRDISSQIEQLRDKMSKESLEPDLSNSTKKEREAWVESTFKLDYDLE